MHIFKLYFKILNKHKGHIIMYISIFIGILTGFILPNSDKQSAQSFTESTVKYAIFDYDESDLSKGITEFLKENHKVKEIKNDDKETIQDALYNMEVSCVVKIHKGYEDNFLKGNAEDKIEVFRIPGTSMAMLFEEDLNNYIKIVDMHIKADYSLDKAMEKAIKMQDINVDVTLTDGKKVEDFNIAHWFFAYMPWVFIGMSICAISPVLVALDKKKIRNRVECSPYKFSRMNIEILLGVLVTGIVICAIFAVIGIGFFTSDVTVIEKMLYIANMICLMLVALAITFLVSKITDKDAVTSLLANIISLGMAFLTGVFVPMEYLSDTVIKIAHFLPSYWYELAVADIDVYKTELLGDIVIYMGIQILFAIAIVVAGIVVSKRKRVMA